MVINIDIRQITGHSHFFHDLGFTCYFELVKGYSYD